MRQQFHLRIREQLHSGAGKPVPPLSAASAPASFKRPTFGVKPAEPETLLDDIDHRGGSLGNAIRMITGQLGNKSAELANLFAAGSRNSIGGDFKPVVSQMHFELFMGMLFDFVPFESDNADFFKRFRFCTVQNFVFCSLAVYF